MSTKLEIRNTTNGTSSSSWIMPLITMTYSFAAIFKIIISRNSSSSPLLSRTFLRRTRVVWQVWYQGSRELTIERILLNWTILRLRAITHIPSRYRPATTCLNYLNTGLISLKTENIQQDRSSRVWPVRDPTEKTISEVSRCTEADILTNSSYSRHRRFPIWTWPTKCLTRLEMHRKLLSAWR